MRRIVFAIPGDLETPTGGYGYDRRVLAEFAGQGVAAVHLALPGAFPHPTAADDAAVGDIFDRSCRRMTSRSSTASPTARSPKRRSRRSARPSSRSATIRSASRRGLLRPRGRAARERASGARARRPCDRHQRAYGRDAHRRFRPAAAQTDRRPAGDRSGATGARVPAARRRFSRSARSFRARPSICWSRRSPASPMSTGASPSWAGPASAADRRRSRPAHRGERSRRADRAARRAFGRGARRGLSKGRCLRFFLAPRGLWNGARRSARPRLADRRDDRRRSGRDGPGFRGAENSARQGRSAAQRLARDHRGCGFAGEAGGGLLACRAGAAALGRDRRASSPMSRKRTHERFFRRMARSARSRRPRRAQRRPA